MFISFFHGARMACVWCVRPKAAIALISFTCRSACYMLRIRYVVCTCRSQLIYLNFDRRANPRASFASNKFRSQVDCWIVFYFVFAWGWAWTIHRENCVGIFAETRSAQSTICFVYLFHRYGHFPRNIWCFKLIQRRRITMWQNKILRDFFTEPTVLRIFPPRIIAWSYRFTRPLTHTSRPFIQSAPYPVHI